MKSFSRIIKPSCPWDLAGEKKPIEATSCLLVSGEQSTLHCAIEGGSKLSIARLTASRPCSSLSLVLTSDCTLSCSSGEVTIFGPPVTEIITSKVPTKESTISKAAELSERGNTGVKRAAATATPDSEAKRHRALSSAEPAVAAAACQDEDSELAARRAALRKATAQVKEKQQAAAAVEAAAQEARDKQAAARAAERETSKDAQEKALRDKAAAQKDAVKRKEQAEKERIQQWKESCKRAGQQVLSSGLRYEVLQPGSGSQAANGRQVNVRYEGHLAKSGRLFDKGAIKFRLGKRDVIRGWDEGIRGMKVGERRKLYIPPHLGYGKRGSPPKIPPNADLEFVVTLLQC